MNNNIDMSKTIAPKSDQMNYDDFLVGNKTITITGVKSTGNVNDQQPVSIHYQGDAGKPYKPCKSMRRVMVKVWGSEGSEYAGKSMTLFGDPNVIFGGQKVGGIRISHMSHIDKEINVPLTASKTKRMPYKVLPLKIDIDVPEDDPSTSDDASQEVYDLARAQAENGTAAYRDFFAALSKVEKQTLVDAGNHDRLKVLAEAVEQKPEYEE